MLPKGVLRLEWMEVTAKQMRAVLTYLRSGLILPTRETHVGEATTTAFEDMVDLVDAFSHFGGCPDLEAQVKAEQTRRLRAPPTNPAMDTGEQYIWQAVPVKAYHNTIAPEGFHLTGEYLKGMGHMWSRKTRDGEE